MRTATTRRHPYLSASLIAAAQSAHGDGRTWRQFAAAHQGGIFLACLGATDAERREFRRHLRRLVEAGTATPEASGGQTVAVVPVLPVVAVATAAGCQSTATR